MRINGQIILEEDSSGFYAVTIPLINMWTQGKDIPDGIDMAEDWLSGMYPDLEYKLDQINEKTGSFVLDSDDPKLIGIILKCARESSGLSLQSAAKKLGFSNHNSIYAYERGHREPTLSKFKAMLDAYGIDFQLYQQTKKSA